MVVCTLSLTTINIEYVIIGSATRAKATHNIKVILSLKAIFCMFDTEDIRTSGTFSFSFYLSNSALCELSNRFVQTPLPESRISTPSI
jgi:hypothetical protein